MRQCTRWRRTKLGPRRPRRSPPTSKRPPGRRDTTCVPQGRNPAALFGPFGTRVVPLILLSPKTGAA